MEIETRANSPVHLTLRELKDMKKEDLITVILIREIMVKNLRDEWTEAINNSVKEGFAHRYTRKEIFYYIDNPIAHNLSLLKKLIEKIFPDSRRW